MAARKPTTLELGILLVFHASISGAFLVAYLTGDEDTYGMHVFSGYTVLGAVAVRLLTGLFAPTGSPLRLPRPRATPVRAWLGRLATGDASALRERSPLLPWIATALLVAVGTAALAGVGADFVTALEDLHEALGEVALWVVFAHIALVLALHWLKRPDSFRTAAGT